MDGPGCFGYCNSNKTKYNLKTFKNVLSIKDVIHFVCFILADFIWRPVSLKTLSVVCCLLSLWRHFLQVILVYLYKRRLAMLTC